MSCDISHRFRCPYYGWSTRELVTCEGGKVLLPDRDTARRYQVTYCQDLNNWRNCTLARALTLHYEALESNGA